MNSAVKNCTKCGQEKPLSAFYKHGAMRDGRLAQCKECVKTRVRQHRNDNLERIREYDRERGKLPHRAALRREIFERFKEREPEKRAAHVAVRNALRRGDLTKQPCVFCGEAQGVEAHHHDYSKPLDVTWLCVPCHRRFHALERLATYRRDDAA